MTYTVRKHVGLRESMAHVYNGSYGTFPNLQDAIAYAHFKHDKLNNTFVCLDDGTIIYGIIPSGQGTHRDAYKTLVQANPWIEWDTKPYMLQKVDNRWSE